MENRHIFRSGSKKEKEGMTPAGQPESEILVFSDRDKANEINRMFDILFGSFMFI